MSNKTSGIKKERIDKLLVDSGLVSTRARAQAMIIAGNVLVDDRPIKKSGEQVDVSAVIRLKEPELKYVSRGALKLKGAIQAFKIIVSGKIAIDVGASTGGFTEILLEEGAEKVYAVDVGTNQLAWKIRSDPRVNARENYNARHLKSEDFDTRFKILVMDVSFISIRLILPAVLQVLEDHADLIVLFKPQFEVGREWVEDGGIVRNQDQAKKVLEETLQWGESCGLQKMGCIDSPIQGTDGNSEYLIHWKYEANNLSTRLAPKIRLE